MPSTTEQRVSELELRIARIEKQLGMPTGEPKTTTYGREKMSNLAENINIQSEAVAAGDDEQAKIKRAEGLFSYLLAEKRLISYSEAYRRIVGPYTSWRNAVHAPEVIRLACKTTPDSVGGLAIRLDSLIVGIQTRRPARGHFVNAAYSEGDWIQTFGIWPLLES